MKPKNSIHTCSICWWWYFLKLLFAWFFIFYMWVFISNQDS
eukprot:UN09122